LCEEAQALSGVEAGQPGWEQLEGVHRNNRHPVKESARCRNHLLEFMRVSSGWQVLVIWNE